MVAARRAAWAPQPPSSTRSSRNVPGAPPTSPGCACSGERAVAVRRDQRSGPPTPSLLGACRPRRRPTGRHAAGHDDAQGRHRRRARRSARAGSTPPLTEAPMTPALPASWIECCPAGEQRSLRATALATSTASSSETGRRSRERSQPVAQCAAQDGGPQMVGPWICSCGATTGTCSASSRELRPAPAGVPSPSSRRPTASPIRRGRVGHQRANPPPSEAGADPVFVALLRFDPSPAASPDARRRPADGRVAGRIRSTFSSGASLPARPQPPPRTGARAHAPRRCLRASPASADQPSAAS